MRTNEISAKLLNTDAHSWIEKFRQVFLIQDKGIRSGRQMRIPAFANS
jgi:hypothetical protein